mgnify:CR=1 FL=1
MIEKLKKCKERYEALTEALAAPGATDDREAFSALSREHAELGEITAAFDRYEKTAQERDDCRSLLSEQQDAEMKALIEEELATLEASLAEQENELKALLLPKDENDDRGIILEIRAGTGGEEASLFGADLLRMYLRYAERHGFKTETISENVTELGGVKEIILSVSGKRGAYARLKFEGGVHRVQRVPETESGGRVHTSTATVAVLPEMEEVDVQINPADIEMQVYRASGAGGQHVNKTDSAIRITHIPTGIVVGCQTERSQVQNKETAMRMLKSKLLEIKEREHLERIEDITGNKMKIEWGSQIRSYVFMPYTLVKDNRTSCETGNIQAVMDGELDDFINEFLKLSCKGTEN